MSDEKPTALTTFLGWHREPSLYREIYARTVATLIAAALVAFAAATAGVLSLESTTRVGLQVVFLLGTTSVVAGVIAGLWVGVTESKPRPTTAALFSLTGAALMLLSSLLDALL